MDDGRIGAMVTALAEPRTLAPDDLDRVAANVARARRRQRLVRGATALGAAAAVAAALVISIPRLSDRGPTASDGGRPVMISARFHGFNLEVVLTYPGPRRLLSGAFVVDGRADSARFYTDANDDVTFRALDIDGGERAYLTGQVHPDCESALSPLVAEVEVRLPNGRTLTQRVSADAASQRTYAHEREWWCSVPAHAAIMISGRGAKGRAHFQMDVDNTTSHTITVVSEHLRYGETNWPRSSVTVPAHGRAQLYVRATGYHGGPKPWDRGLLTADGVPIRVSDH